MKKLALAALLVALTPAARAQTTTCSGIADHTGLFTMNCTTTQSMPLPVGPGPKRGEVPWYDKWSDEQMGKLGLVWTCKPPVHVHGIERCEWDRPPKQEVAP